MSNQLTQSENQPFVKPYYIEELGCEGLSAKDIAISLDADPSKVRRKLADRGFLDRLKTQSFQALPIGLPNETNGLQYTEYYLDVNAAKFFVAKYDSELGDAYLAYLIRLENAYNEGKLKPVSARQEALSQIKTDLEVFSLFKVPEHLAQIEAVKAAKTLLGVDYSRALELSPVQNNIKQEEEMLEPTELAKKLWFKNPAALNKKLASLGLQVKNGVSWEPTNKVPQGKVSKHAWTKGTKSGYNLKWNMAFIEAALKQHL